MTFFFLIVILGVDRRRAPAGFAPLAIGLALTLIHLISIPVTNTSVNPARSTGPALFVGGWALAAALAVLGRADGRRGDRRLRLQVAGRRGEGRGAAAGRSRRNDLVRQGSTPSLCAARAGTVDSDMKPVQ